MPTRFSALAGAVPAGLAVLLWAAPAPAQEPQPWQRSGDPRTQQRDDAYPQQYGGRRYEAPDEDEREAAPPARRDAYPGPARPADAYPPRTSTPRNDAYSPRAGQPDRNDAYSPPQPSYAQRPGAYSQPYSASPRDGYPAPNPTYGQPYGRPYAPPPEQAYNDRPDRYDPPPYDRRYGPPPGPDEAGAPGYTSGEILNAGHGFFGGISKGLASVVEYVFQQQGRPNGYILGQEASGAFVAGLRYGEGMLYTKDAGIHRVYWQGPSIGYDAGAEGSKVMMLVYNLHDPREIYQRFPGVDGSAYFVGGVGVTFQSSGDIVIAPIRAGVGLRLGANVGYLKYTRHPTWNPF